MNEHNLRPGDVVGLVKLETDAHTLGISVIQQLLEDCGIKAVIGDEAISRAVSNLERQQFADELQYWLTSSRVTHLGFSCRLDPDLAVSSFSRLHKVLENHQLLAGQRHGCLSAIFFAGLPQACDAVRRNFGQRVSVFSGDESSIEALTRMGVHRDLIPLKIHENAAYDELRLSFGRELIRREQHTRIAAPGRPDYAESGTARDGLTARLRFARLNGRLPLMRAHAGPFLPKQRDAVRLMIQWMEDLSKTGFLDIISIGSSQLTQSRFGENWGGEPNGGGVPINRPEDFMAIATAARPMLVRAYSGTKDVPAYAEMLERTINIAWHALSLWWFCQLDGRGPLSLRENLEQHVAALNVAANTNKPVENNTAHHFAFRGADDVSSIVTAYLAARMSKKQGVRTYVLQNMLNVPRSTAGVQELAKSRVLLALVRKLQDSTFRVIYQPRAGLDYFSPDLEKAKAQLAASTALMYDVEPDRESSPEIIHVVSYSEAVRIADPSTIDDSVRITAAALKHYPEFRCEAGIDAIVSGEDVTRRTQQLWTQATALINAIESSIPDTYSPGGLYRILKDGFIAMPQLWGRRDEFERATRWKTRLINGGVKIVDDDGLPITLEERLALTSRS